MARGVKGTRPSNLRKRDPELVASRYRRAREAKEAQKRTMDRAEPLPVKAYEPLAPPRPDRFASARQKLAENRQNRRLATQALAVATIPGDQGTDRLPLQTAAEWVALYRLEREKRAPILAQREAEAMAEVRAIIQRADERQAVHNRGGRPRKQR